MGGEPTYVPEDPEGPEWNFAAVGPTKLLYAYAFARAVEKEVWPGSLLLYSPGKLYPGEVNPRWAVHVLRPEKPFELSGEARENKPDERVAKQFRDGVVQKLGLEDRWVKAVDPKEPKKSVWVLPLDHQEDRWRTEKWNLRRFELTASRRTKRSTPTDAGPASRSFTASNGNRPGFGSCGVIYSTPVGWIRSNS